MAENLNKIRPAITGMVAGESRKFPIEKLRYVRVSASELGVMLNRKYRTALDREARTVTVTRVK